MSLIGRRAELAAVARLLDRSAAGTGGHLVVTGPAGAGKSALADAAAELAAARGVPVFRVTGSGPAQGSGPEDGLAVWDRLAGALDSGETADDAEERPGDSGEPPADAEERRPGDDVDRIVRLLARGGPRLLLIDDLDRAGPPAVAVLARLAPLLETGATALLVTAARHLGMPPELRLRDLTEAELAELLGPGHLGLDLSADAVHAVWLASVGLPGAAAVLAREPAGLDTTEDPFVHLALTMPSRASFLDIDVGLIRLLEATAERSLPPAARARVLARLARELLGDPSAGARRRKLIDEATTLAVTSDDPGTIAEVLDSGLHALWDPAAVHERLTVGARIIAHARPAGDNAAERRGLFWRFTAQMELGDLRAAEAELTAYARAGELAGDAESAAVVAARQSMLAAVRGQFDLAAELAGEAAVLARRAGLADADRLVGTLHAAVATLRGHPLVAPWQTMARRLPGHFFEASAARALAESGHTVEAGLELERLLPAVLAGSGPRWLGVAADLAIVAAKAEDPAAAQLLYEALYPYHGRLAVWGGANTVTGPVDDYLGRLAGRLGRPGRALAHLDSAAELEQRIGALPWLAHTLLARAAARRALGGETVVGQADEDLSRARSIAGRLGLDGLLARLDPPADEWRLIRDGDDWRLEAGAETARLRDARGMGYLRTLLAAPGQEIAALDLVAGGAGLRVPDGAPVLDDSARRSYRRRLDELGRQLEAADRAGDVEQAAEVHRERTALVAELRRAGGLGGRVRRPADEAERARVNATRALWAAVRRVESAAPLAGAHLGASLRTGRFFRYQPAPGGPARWRV